MKNIEEIFGFTLKLDKGSEFHFTIPSSPNTIILVEDNIKERILYEDIIKQEFPSFEILCAENGYEAISIVMNKIPSLVITNHDMPLMNGVQLIESIRKKEKNYRIPVIALVQQLSEELKNLYFGFGIENILEKPLDIELFTKELHSLIE